MEGMLNKWVLVLSIIAVTTMGVNLAIFVGIYPALFGSSARSEEYGYYLKTIGNSGIPSTLQQDSGQVEQQMKTISATGVGAAKAKPDRATISFSVVTQADTADKALSENAIRMDNVIKVVRAAGILENQTETATYSLNPIWEYPKEGSPRIAGYTCSNTIRVTVKNLDKMGEIIDLAVSSGANQVSSLQFTISEEAMFQLGLKALSLAVKDADTKARTIADAAELTLVGPISISVSGYSPYVRSYVFESAAESVITPILAPEEVSITISVSVIYEFK
ncbi:MAG: SIMPL domain-containing protein [Thermoproteota archaeon]